MSSTSEEAVVSRPSSRSGTRKPGTRNGDLNGKERKHSKRLCSDWLVSYESNFSVAKDREWFTSYTPFASYVLDHKGALIEVLGIGSVTLPVMCSSSSFDDEDPTQRPGELGLQEVLHIPNAVCNVVSRQDPILGRQELWTLPSEKDPYKRGVMQHRRAKQPGTKEVEVSVYIPPNSGSLCLLDLDFDSPPTGYALAPASIPAYTAGDNESSKMMVDMYSGDLIPRTWPTNQRESWNRRKETGEDDLCACESANATATGTTGPRIKTAELVKKLMDQRVGLISQLKTLDELIDEVQGVTPPPAATTIVSNSDTTPVFTSTPSVSAVVDHSEVCNGGEDTTQTPDFVCITTEEEGKAMTVQEAMTEVDAMEWEETIAEAMEWEECPAEAESMEESTAEVDEVAEEEILGEKEAIAKEEALTDEETVAKEEVIEEVIEDEKEKVKEEDTIGKDNQGKWETQTEVWEEDAKNEARAEEEAKIEEEANLGEEVKTEEQTQVEQKVEEEDEAQWETESEEESPGEVEERGAGRCRGRGQGRRGKGRENVKAGKGAQVEEKEGDYEEAQWETQSEGDAEEEKALKEEEEGEAEPEPEESVEEKVAEEQEQEEEQEAEEEAEEGEEQEPEPEAKAEESDQNAAYHWTSADAAGSATWFTSSTVAYDTTPADAAESAQRFTTLRLVGGRGLTVAYDTTPAEAAESAERFTPSRVAYDTTSAEAAKSAQWSTLWPTPAQSLKSKWVPFASIGFSIVGSPDRGNYHCTFTVDVPGEYDDKMWSYDKVKRNKLSDEEKAWLKAVSKYRPNFLEFFKRIGYDADTDIWELGRGGGRDRATVRTLVKWLRVHARPPASYGEEVMVDLDAGVPNDYGLAAAKERLRALRVAGRERSPEARQEHIFIQDMTLWLRSEGVNYDTLSYRDDPGARCWRCEDIFGED